MPERLFQRFGDARRVARRLGRGNVLPNGVEQGANAASAVFCQLAPDQIHRLHPIGAFVDLGDAGVADKLLHAPFADVAMAAEHLLGIDRGLEAAIGQIALDDRGQHRD